MKCSGRKTISHSEWVLHMPHRFEIKAEDDLLMLETIAAGIQALPPDEPVEIRLARKLGSQFFKESRIASLLISIVRAGRHLTVSDWHNEWREADVSSYFQQSLEWLRRPMRAESAI